MCAVPPLEIGVQTIQSSPYRSGVAGPQRTHLPLFPALPTCSCPLALSGLGQLFASESWTLNSGHLWWQFRPCVTRRTLSSHTAHDRGAFTGNFHFANSTEHSPWSACAFVGYLCTISLPSPSGPSPCARFSRVRTTMPHLTAWRASEVLDRVSPTYFHPPSHPLQALPCSQHRTQTS